MTGDSKELRYGFGKNWAEFVDQRLSEDVIQDSRQHLAEMLRTDNLFGKVFLDIGCGSGIHSLAALRMGAERVVAFDYDHDSVATARRVHAYAGAPANWEIMQGSVLDEGFMRSLPVADIVYSWGVLHHTGDMWAAVRNAGIPLAENGIFYIALYSSDNYVDPPPAYWMKVKRAYNFAPQWRKSFMEWQYMMRWHFLPEVKAGRNPWTLIRKYGSRGMTYWTDVKDWLGGWPMDFASLDETQKFCVESFGLSLVNVKTGEGCTEYVFARPDRNEHWKSIIASRHLIPLERPFSAAGGKSYSVALTDLASVADDADDPRRSRLMVFEDGRPLGLAHSLHDHIARFAGGRFCHWGPTLYFSASDGSDPNRNGRSYAYCERF